MIGILGLNHKTAGVDIREMFYISKDEISPLSENVFQKTDVSELVVLSTCNRTEIYYFTESDDLKKVTQDVIQELQLFKGVESDYSFAFYSMKDKEAVKHLFGVASGLDSMLIGENQIVKQVKESYVFCTKLALADAVLMRLFQKAFQTSKRVRTETDIQQGATSLSYVAVDKCQKTYDDLSNKKVLLIGTGEMGKIALDHMRKKGATDFIIANRTYARAVHVAEFCNGKAVPFAEYKKYLPESDVVITATNAQDHIISKRDIESEVGDHSDLRMFIDLSVPRNIDENIASLPNTQLLGIDDLQVVIDKTNDVRSLSVEKSNVIIDQMQEEYFEWLNARKLKPIIKSISSKIEKIKEQELDLSIDYSPEDLEKLNEFANRLSQKYIRSFVKSIKELSSEKKDDNLEENLLRFFEHNPKK